MGSVFALTRFGVVPLSPESVVPAVEVEPAVSVVPAVSAASVVPAVSVVPIASVVPAVSVVPAASVVPVVSPESVLPAELAEGPVLLSLELLHATNKIISNADRIVRAALIVLGARRDLLFNNPVIVD